MEAYLDNSATTHVCGEAIAAMNDAMVNVWGNPSSLHSKGIEASGLLEYSREAIAGKLMCDPTEVYFTSGGTEANNLAVFGAAAANRRKGKRIVTTSVEHPSIDEAVRQLEADGFEVVRLGVDRFGRINERELFSAVDRNTILVSIMLVNNEVGTVQPVEAAKRAVTAARAPALIHCDAVQAFGKLPVKPSVLGADLLTISSHKIHGPKGVGALYVAKGAKITPRTFGGSQESLFRPGTEPMPAIAGFGAAVRALPDVRRELDRVRKLRDYMVMRLSAIDGVVINSSPDALPYVTNISVIGLRSEPIINFLSARGIYVSGGSACSKGKKSRVLLQMGLSPELLDAPLRISFSRYTTAEQIDMLVLGIAEAKKHLRGTK